LSTTSSPSASARKPRPSTKLSDVTAPFSFQTWSKESSTVGGLSGLNTETVPSPPPTRNRPSSVGSFANTSAPPLQHGASARNTHPATPKLATSPEVLPQCARSPSSSKITEQYARLVWPTPHFWPPIFPSPASMP
jgi:hypothetical protein